MAQVRGDPHFVVPQAPRQYRTFDGRWEGDRSVVSIMRSLATHAPNVRAARRSGSLLGSITTRRYATPPSRNRRPTSCRLPFGG